MSDLSRFVTATDGLLRKPDGFVTKGHQLARLTLQIVTGETNPPDN
jgi:hypothetical protein